jgi:hypothetical protein
MVEKDIEHDIHPDADKLKRFGQGLLSPAEAATLEEHFAACDECCRLLEALPNDSFVGQLRDARDLPSPDTQHFAVGYSIPADESLGDLADNPRYRVIRLLGRGGMGAVYLAEHRRMGRLVALKIINPELLNHSGALMRFQQEVKTAAKLDHANIVAAFDADQAGSAHFLVMEYVEGHNLADYLTENGPLAVSQACDVIRQAALGLQHAHERGMVHRDIKPHNLMLTPSGQVKVLDFGLARFAMEPASTAISEQASTATGLTGAGAVMGTADYIAPGQARDAHLADGRSDIYSLGCTLYHLLTEQPPFPKGTTREKLQLHSTNFPLWLRDVRPEIPEGLARVVAKMMAKKPEDRYQTAAEVAAALKPHAGNTNSKRAKVRRTVIAVAIVVVAGVLAGGLWMFRPVNDHGEPEAASVRKTEGENLAAASVGIQKAGEVRRWRGHSAYPVFRIVVAPDGRSAWSVADDFRRWDVATGTTIQQVATPDPYEELLPTLDGKQLLTRDRYWGIVRFHDAATMKQVRSFDSGRTSYWQTAWFPDGRRVLTDGADAVVRIWDTDAGVPILELPGQKGVACVAVSQDGTQFLTGYEMDGVLKVWDLKTQKVRFEIAEQVGHPNSAHFVQGGKAILTCGRDGSVRLFDAKTCDILKVFSTPKKSIPWARIALLKDGRHFVCADALEFLRLWDMETGEERYTARTEFGGAASLAVTPDGRDVLIGTFHGQIVQWRFPDVAVLEKADAK